jgi:tetratricopeptide (TPR) repeat protein
MEIDSDLSGHSDNTFYVALIAAILLLALAAGFVYWRYIPARVDYSALYESLGVAPLPSNIETLSQIQRPLDQLNREACYKDAIADLSESLIKVRRPREAATSVRYFVKRCKNSEGLLQIAYSALESISDYQGALEVADQLVEAYPATGTFRYRRARAYDHLDDFSHALTDYLNTVQLDNDPQDLLGDVFFNASRMYAALGRPCDAIMPMETYISFDPVNRRTPQNTKIVADYADKGNCDTGYATGAARIATSGQSNVHLLRVFLNSVSGTFILDTGATFVAVTPQFASKARIDTEPGRQIIRKRLEGLHSPTLDLRLKSLSGGRRLREWSSQSIEEVPNHSVMGWTDYSA